MSDLKRYLAEQCANDPEFAKAYDEEKALEKRAQRLAEFLAKDGWSLRWTAILAVLEADREFDELYPDL